MPSENDLNQLKEQLLHPDPSFIKEQLEYIHPVDILSVLHEFPNEAESILNQLPDETIALLMDFEEDEDKYELLMHFSARRQKTILEEMSSDEITGLVHNLDEKEKQDLLEKMNQEDREEVSALLQYHDKSAGSLMATEFISIRENKTILKTLEYLHTAVEDAEMVYYLYVIDRQDHLKGVVSLRDIVASDFDTRIAQITNPHVVSVHVDDDQEAVANVFAKYDYLMLPVVNDENVICGVITVDDVIDIIQEETTEDIHRLAGLDEEEKVDGSLKDSIRSRLPWLTVNLVTAVLAAAVVALFSGTIEQVVALAAINPIIAGMGGNAGTQSLTLIVRGIALGELSGKNALRVFLKEFGVGIFCGLSLGAIVALGCLWIYGNPMLGIVAGFAMLTNLIIATVSGFSVPLILEKFSIDPALASSIFVTTATDVLGFFVFLGLATLMLPYLI